MSNDLKLIHAFGKNLSTVARSLLHRMMVLADDEEASADGEDELVRDKRSWYLGDDRVSPKAVRELLLAVAIKDVSVGAVERYVINETGRDIINGP